MNYNRIKNNIIHLIEECVDISRKRILILFDDTTERISDFFFHELEETGRDVKKCLIETNAYHGVELSERVVNKMLSCDLIMCITKFSLAHTNARRLTEAKGIGFLSMPDYNFVMLENDAFQVDFHKAYQEVWKFTKILTEANNIEITSEKGTKLVLDVTGRKGNCCPGYIDSNHLLGSPPDIEANIAPIEDKTNGIIVVDGTITDERVGLLQCLVILTILDGVVVDIKSDDAQIEIILKNIFQNVKDDKAYIIGELGIGFNNKAKLCGNMLIDEGVKGCVHFGIGSNWTIGGKNKVSFHLDFVVKNVNIISDGIKLIEEGVII